MTRIIDTSNQPPGMPRKRFRRFVVYPLLALAGVLSLLAALSHWAYTGVLEATSAEETVVARLIAQQVEQKVRAAKIILAGVALRVSEAPDANTGFQRAIEGMAPRLAFEPEFLSLKIARLDGTVVQHSGAANWAGSDDSRRDYFQGAAARGSEFHVGFAERPTPSETLELTVGHRLYDRNSAFVGVASLSLDVNRLQKTIAARVAPKDRAFLVVRADGVILFRSPDLEQTVAGRNVSDRPLFREDIKRAPEGPYRQTSSLDAQARIGGYSSSPDHDLIVVSSRNESAVRREKLLGHSQIYAIAITAVLGVLALFAYGIVELRRRNTLIEERELLSKSLAIAESAVAISDFSGNLVYVNRSFERITGYSANEIIGKNCRILQGLGTDLTAIAAIRDAIAALQPVRVDILNYTKNGSEYWADLNIAPVHDADGKVTAFMSTFVDITLRKKIEAELHSSLELAKSAERSKSAFLMRMSHELRTPLNAIIGFAEAMSMRLMGPLSDRYVGYAENIGSSGLHLRDLIESILEMSRLENNARELDNETIDLKKIVDQAVILSRSEIDAAKATLEIIQDGVVMVKGDALALRQITVNLIVNAARYGGKGCAIKVLMHVLPNKNIHLIIEDSGPGFPDEVLRNLGTPFVGTRTEIAGSTGLGLGLAISLELVKRMGGNLTISNSMRGAVVTVDIPSRDSATRAA